MAQLTDSDIVSRLTNVEDATIERKTAKDYRDCVKTTVAFSNSLPIGEPGLIFVGVYDDGRIEDGTNCESLQKKVSGEISNIYPAVYPQVLVRKNGGRNFLVVVVHGSANRPHFAGQAYVRDGTQTTTASEDQFQELIAKRSSKAAEILKWKDRLVTLDFLNTEETTRRMGRVASTVGRTLRACNQFCVTLEDPNNNPKMESITLRRVEITYDHHNSRLKLEVYPL